MSDAELGPWEKSLSQFLFENGTAKFSHGRHRYVYTDIFEDGRHIVTADFRKQVLLVLGWDHPNGGSSYLTGALLSGATSADSSWVTESWIFVPVLTLKPDHETNLWYLNQVIDYALIRLTRRKVKTGMAGASYRVTERSLDGYVKFYDLASAYTPPTLEERAERLGVTAQLAGFIGRRIAA